MSVSPLEFHHRQTAEGVAVTTARLSDDLRMIIAVLDCRSPGYYYVVVGGLGELDSSGLDTFVQGTTVFRCIHVPLAKSLIEISMKSPNLQGVWAIGVFTSLERVPYSNRRISVSARNRRNNPDPPALDSPKKGHRFWQGMHALGDILVRIGWCVIAVLLAIPVLVLLLAILLFGDPVSSILLFIAIGLAWRIVQGMGLVLGVVVGIGLDGARDLGRTLSGKSPRE